jgi:phospholipase C
VRRLLLIAGLAGAIAAGASGPALGGASPSSPWPTKTPIKHFITLMQENHTYDNYFGTYPRGDGLQPGTCMPVDPAEARGRCVKPFHIGDNKVVVRDLDHSHQTFVRQLNRGRMNGFVNALNLRNQDGRLSMGYYDDRDLPYYWNIADEYVIYDRFFSSAAAGSFLNHLYWVAGSAGGGVDRIPLDGLGSDVPTIFDRLEKRGISWKFYVQNYDARLNYRTVNDYPGNRASQVIWVPVLNFPRFLDRPDLFSHIVPLEHYYRDLERGTLPAVSFIAPSGPSEHPPSSVLSGQAFVRTLINTLVRSSYWKSSAFMITYDDWGGWYDHVKPRKVDKYGYGFRVPAMLVSPFARRGHVDSTVLDYTSLLKFIEENWGVPPMGERDRKATSFASGFDFSRQPRIPRFTSFDRGTVKREPNNSWMFIYTLYGGVLLLAEFAICWAVFSRGRAARDPAVALGEQGGAA